MDKLTNKQSLTFDYPSRYAGIPFYYDTVAKREVLGCLLYTSPSPRD